MIKKVLSLAMATLLFVGLKAQSVETVQVKIGDGAERAYQVAINHNGELTQNALKHCLEKEGKLKSKKKDGFIAYLNQTYNRLCSSAINLYTKVEEQGKKADKTALVTMCAKPMDLTVDVNVVNSAVIQFLEEFSLYVDKYEAYEKMEIEQENLKKAQKVQEKAVSEKEKIEKNIKKDEEKISDKKKDIEKYKEKIKDCEKDIKDLENEIAKNKEKKTNAEKAVQEANDNVKAVEAEVKKYEALSK